MSDHLHADAEHGTEMKKTTVGKTCWIHVCQWLLVGLIPPAMSNDNVTSNAWKIVPMRTTEKKVELPPLAVVKSEDSSGETWRKSGTISGGLPVARAAFRKILEQQGWKFDKVIPLDSGRQIRELCLWTRGQRSMMLMLWEIEDVGKCSFTLGEIMKQPEKTKGDR